MLQHLALSSCNSLVSCSTCAISTAKLTCQGCSWHSVGLCIYPVRRPRLPATCACIAVCSWKLQAVAEAFHEMKGVLLGAAVVLALVTHNATGRMTRRLRQNANAPPILGTINLPPMLSFSDVPVTAVIRRGPSSPLLPVIPPGLLPGLTPVRARAGSPC